MKFLNLLTIFALLLSLSFTSCKEKSAEEATAAGETATETAETTTVAPDPNVAVDPNAPAPTTDTPAPTGPTTKIAFDEMKYDWGTVMDGAKVTKVFKFKNTGSEPLVISNAKASCGCTVPEWPKEAIAPGKSGEIKVVYDSKGKGKVGGQKDTKRITITANTDPVDTYLNIEGIVDKKEEK